MSKTNISRNRKQKPLEISKRINHHQTDRYHLHLKNPSSLSNGYFLPIPHGISSKKNIGINLAFRIGIWGERRRQTDRQTDGRTDTDTVKQRETDRQRDRQTDRQTETERQKERRTDRQTERE